MELVLWELHPAPGPPDVANNVPSAPSILFLPYPVTSFFQMGEGDGVEWLLKLLRDVQLEQFFTRLRDDLQITRLSHFDFVKPEDLERIGLGTFLYLKKQYLQSFWF